MRPFVTVWMIVLMLAPCGAQAAESAPNVEVFVTGWCRYCRQLESFLKKNDIEYTRYDIEKDADGSRLFTELGGRGVPLSRVGKQVIRGYDPEGLLLALEGRGEARS